MIVVKRLSDIPSTLKKPCGLTIGSFDGVHLGHQSLLKHMQKRLFYQGTLGLLTFSNHPAHILPHRKLSALLCSMDQKLQLLKKFGVNLVILLEFSKELSETPYELFLTKIKEVFPFQFLILGEGARLGKGREGDEEKIKALGHRHHFEAEYLKKMSLEGEDISSGRIRQLIESGDFKQAERLLGRPYVIDTFLSFEKEGSWVNLKGRCLPKGPQNYGITIRQNQLNYPAILHIGNDEDKILITFIEKKALPLQGPIEIFFD